MHLSSHAERAEQGERIMEKLLRVSAAVVGLVVASGLLGASARLQQEFVLDLPIGPSPYTVVEGWLKPFAPAGHAFGAQSGVFAESPDRIFIVQRGEIRLPDPVPPGFAGFVGSIGLNALEAGDDRVWRNSIFVVDGDGNMIESWTQWDDMWEGGAGPHKVKINPHDPDRKVWVVDETNHQVHAFTNDGSALVMTIGDEGPGAGETNFNRPQDVAFLEDGSIFVADYENARVVKFDAQGNFVTEWGTLGIERGQFNGVHAVATDSIGRIYVADRENDRIQVFNETTRSVWYHPNISPIASWPGFEFPNDIYATGYEVWVADNQEPQLIKLDWNGNPQFAFDIGAEGEGPFRIIHQFSVDAERNLYASDTMQGRTRKLVPREGASFTELMGRPDPALR